MANAVFPTPFTPGFRLFRGEDLNSNLSNPPASSQQSVTAHAGGTRAAAFPVTAAITNVTTVATAADSLVMPSAASNLGKSFTIYNNGANALTLYALASDTINGTAGATGVSVPPGGQIVLQSIASAKWLADTTGGSVSSVVLDGATSGSITLQATAVAGSNTQTLPAVTGVSASTSGSNLFIADVYRTSAAVTKNANVTPATVTGLSGAVAVGTYRFRAALPSTVASGTGGIAYSFLLTTAVLSAMEATGIGYTASAVAVQHTTTATSGTALFTQAAVVIMTVVEGTFVVSTAGTFAIQMCQNTSNASDTVALVGGSLELCRIA